MLKIRPAKISDVENFKDLFKVTYRETYPGFFTEEELSLLAIKESNQMLGILQSETNPENVVNVVNVENVENVVNVEKEMNIYLLAVLASELLDDVEVVLGYSKIVYKLTHRLIDKLYILKEYHGKGYGKKLLNASEHFTHPSQYFVRSSQNVRAEKGVRDIGIDSNKLQDKIKLYVWTENNHAIKFYQSNGYESDYELHPYINLDGEPSGKFDYLMTKTIDHG